MRTGHGESGKAYESVTPKRTNVQIVPDSAGAGRVLSRTDTAGLTLTNTYDAAGRLSSAVTKTPANAVVSSYGYTYDSASNVTGPLQFELRDKHAQFARQAPW